MAQQINDNFQLLAALPIDDRNRKSTITERDNISSTRRFQGLMCFVQQTQTLYMLIGGIANTNWVGIAGANATSDLETVIEGFYVLSAGKEFLLDWEVGDKFRGWIGSRYVVGEILSLPVSLPSDIDNPAKVKLAIDSANVPDEFSNIVYVNNANPNVATIFDLNNPPTVNDDGLKNDVSNLYIGTDGSAWVYNSVTLNYVTKTIYSDGSNFYLAGTIIDASGNKTGSIERSGNVALRGVTTFGTESGTNQTLWKLPATTELTYKDSGGLDYDFNIGTNSPNSFFWKNSEGAVYQAMYFGDGSDVTNAWGISASENAGLKWQSSIVANARGRIGINNNNPRYNLDVFGINRTRGVVSSDTEISISPTVWNATFVSPNLASSLAQGYISDGVNHYQLGTSRIAKYNSDYSTLLVNNTTPFAGISGVDHIGSGCFLNGLLYIPVANESATPIITNEKIAVYNASDLTLVTTYDISSYNIEGASITTDGEFLYLFAYYGDGTKFWKLSLTGVLISDTTLTNPLQFIQGASLYNGIFYVSDQDDLYAIPFDGSSTTKIATAPNSPIVHRAQGLCVVNGEVRWNVLNGSGTYNTHFLNPFISANPLFKADNLGKVKTTYLGAGVYPETGIHVKGSSSADSKITMERTSGAVGRYSMGVQNGTNQWGINDDAQGNLTRFVISKDGNIGIGYSVVTDPILLGNKLSVNGKGYFNGTVRINDGLASTDAVSKAQLDLKANLASPPLTGVPTAPTAATGTNTTQLATTAFVASAVNSASYTPTVTASTNVTSATLSSATYAKIGNIVTGTVSINMQATAINLLSEITITAPVNRAAVVPNYYVGTGTYMTDIIFGAGNAFFSGSSANTITLRFNSGASVASAGSCVFTFQYDITK